MRRALQIDLVNEHLTAVAEWRGSGELPTPAPPRRMVDVTDRPDAVVGLRYDAEADTFSAPPAPPDYGRTVDARTFQMLFTQAERIAIRTAATSDPEAEDYARLAELPIPIRLKHPTTLAGLQMLVSKGLLTSDRATAITNGVAPV